MLFLTCFLYGAAECGLEEYLAFRHVVRNIYGFELDPSRVERLANNYYQTWLVFKQDLEIFTQWLEQLADNWEE